MTSNFENNVDINNYMETYIKNNTIVDNNIKLLNDTTNYTLSSVDYLQNFQNTNQSICLFDCLYFEKKESNILIINYNKAFIWDSSDEKFKIINIKNIDYNLIETNKTFESISNNIAFDSFFSNSTQVFLTLLLEQNDLIFIDSEKNENYKFCSNIKKWILLDNKTSFNIEFDNKITVANLKKNNYQKKISKNLLIEKIEKIKTLSLEAGYVYAPYVINTNIVIGSNANINNRIYNIDNSYYISADVANSNI